MPVACDTSAQAVQTALKRAPGAVRLDGVRLSDCFTRAADPAQIQQVGGTFVDAAEALADRMRKAPRSQAAVELGYLIGAVHRGAGNTQGIHYETVRRIDQVLVGLDRRSPEFARGERAGMRSG